MNRLYAWFIPLCLGCLIGCETRPTESPSSEAVTRLHGAGATFPAPLYEKWIAEFATDHPEIPIRYDVVGSGEGTERFLAGTVDFGASDAALTDEQMASVERGVQLIPVTAGSIVLAYNKTGMPSQLKLSREVYVDILLGKIRMWNDSRILTDNPGQNLPDKPIFVVTREDAGGTTFAFTNHLSAVSEEWRNGPGVGKRVQWPVSSSSGRGNEQQAGDIARTPGAFGYIEYGMAKRSGLGMAWIENKDGQFIEPTGTSGLATLFSTPLPENLRAFFPDPEGTNSYPIVTYTWLLLYKTYDDPAKADALKTYVRWCLTEGQQYNESLGYIRLAPDTVEKALAALKNIGN
jgi:phosphate transport system substrate-binding protein